MAVWFGQDLTHAYAIISRLRRLRHEMDAMVAAGMEPFFACEPGVRVVGVYPDPIMSPGQALVLPGAAHLVATATAEEAAPLAEQARAVRRRAFS